MVREVVRLVGGARAPINLVLALFEVMLDAVVEMYVYIDLDLCCF